MKVIIAIVIFGLLYAGASVYYNMMNPGLFSKSAWCSRSIEESKRYKLYIGEYRPLQETVKLKDGTVSSTKVAWIEHKYRIKRTMLFFVIHKEKTDRYCLVFPPFDGYVRETPVNVFLHRLQADGSIASSYYSYPQGYIMDLREVPDSFQIDVVQQDDEHKSWRYPVIVDTISYEKTF